MKILVIEDNEISMKLVTTILVKAGHEVIKAKEAETGIELAKQELPALILMDMHLPGMDGIVATRLLKKITATQSIPVIALTAMAMKGDEVIILDAGCAGYVSKPISYKELLNTISEY